MAEAEPGQQALLVLAHLRKGETFAELAAGFGVGVATAWRYVHETVALLAARAPKVRQAVQDAKKAGYAYVDVDVINVSKIESMLKNATEKAPAAGGLAAAASGGAGRFARDAAEYATATGVRLRVVPGGDPAASFTSHITGNGSSREPTPSARNGARSKRLIQPIA